MDLQKALKHFFGYDSFLDHQLEVVEQVSSGRDLCVVMPTGAGKSLCYQLPILSSDSYGIIVSPLISLMKDQVDSLLERSLPAACLNTSIPYEKQREILAETARGISNCSMWLRNGSRPECSGISSILFLPGLWWWMRHTASVNGDMISVPPI